MSIDYAPYTTATLVGYGWDFVAASVVSFEPAIFNTPDGRPWPGFPEWPRGRDHPEALIYTPVNVMIDRTITGSWSRGPNQFLIEGGSIGCYTMWVDDVPRVTQGARYVFILSEALDMDGQNPLPLPKARFAWPVNVGGTVITVDGPMSIDALAEIVMDASPSGDIGEH